MRYFLVIVAAFTLGAAYPVAAQPAADAASCAALVVAGEPGCCETAPGAHECPGAYCVGALACVAPPERGQVPGTSDAPVSVLARLIAPPARAPDTAPPKPVA